MSSCNEGLERMWKNKKYFNPDVFAKWHIRVNFFRQGDTTTWISLEILNINARTFAQHTTIFKSTLFYSRVHLQRKNLKTIISTRQLHKVSYLQQLHSYCRCMILQIAAMSDNHTKSLADLLAFNQHFADINDRALSTHHYWANNSRDLITLTREIYDDLHELKCTGVEVGFARALSVPGDGRRRAADGPVQRVDRGPARPGRGVVE